MKKLLAITALGLAISLMSTTSHAGLIGVSGGLSNLGDIASIITAPADANDDAAYNTAQQGFDEKQGVLLGSALGVDGGSIAAGMTVDSHMIFLNSGPGNLGTLLEHFRVTWDFDGMILGVMSNSSGGLEVASSGLLGAAGTAYPGTAFPARGLEGSHASCNLAVDDCYSFSGSSLLLTMRVTEPGDWIRVITKSSVPEPSAILLMALGLAGLGLTAKRRHANA